ncbi:Hypothetical predicted protein [Olea europaea subsp. europaea]|uniref:Uncharacterized protein n=1 Tax=Olea europaea subsp. europaea TaxID=158383 RepID=A0A8S0R5Z0_OLEEU|nr:Hypothetical predicted protein [Olea europaea subsp. europaea]
MGLLTSSYVMCVPFVELQSFAISDVPRRAGGGRFRKGKGDGGGRDGRGGKGSFGGRGGDSGMKRGDSRSGGRGGRGGKGGRGGGMREGSKVIVEPHRHEGAFIAKGKEDALCNKNMGGNK